METNSRGLAGGLMRGVVLCDVSRAAFVALHPGALPLTNHPTSALPGASARPAGPQGAAEKETAAPCLLWPAAGGEKPQGSGGAVNGYCRDLARAAIGGPLVAVPTSLESGQFRVSRGAEAGGAGLVVGGGALAPALASQPALTASWGTPVRQESMGTARYDPDRRGYRIFIGNLAGSTSHDDLANLFTPYGPIVDVWLASNPPGFGFVVFKSAIDAERAVEEKNNSTYMGRVVKVQHARMFKDRTAKPAPAAVHNALDKVRSRSSSTSSRSRSRARSRSETSRSRSASSDRMSFFSKVYGSARGRSRTSSRSGSRARSWSGSSFLTISAASSGSSSRSGSDSRSRSRSHSRCSSRRHRGKRRSHSSKHRRRYHHRHRHRRGSEREGREWGRRQRGLHSSASSGGDQDGSEADEAEVKGRASDRPRRSGSSRSGSRASSAKQGRTSSSPPPDDDDDEALTLAAVPSRRGRRDPPEVSFGGCCRHCRHCARRGSPQDASPARSRRSSRRSRRRQHKRGWRQEARFARRTSSTSESSTTAASSLSPVTKRPCLALEWTSEKHSGSEQKPPKNHPRQQADVGLAPASPDASGTQQSNDAESTVAAAKQPRVDVNHEVAVSSSRPSQTGRQPQAQAGGNPPSLLSATIQSASQPDQGASLQRQPSDNSIKHSQSCSKSLIHGNVLTPTQNIPAVCADDNAEDGQREDTRLDAEHYQRNQRTVLNTKDSNDNFTKIKHLLFNSTSSSLNTLEVPEAIETSGNTALNNSQDQWPHRSVGKTQIKFSLSRNSAAFEVVARAQRQPVSAISVGQEGGGADIVQHHSQSRTEGHQASSPKASLETRMCFPLSPRADNIQKVGTSETIISGAVVVNEKTIADVQFKNTIAEKAAETSSLSLSTSHSSKEDSASLNLASSSRIDDVHIQDVERIQAGVIVLTSTMKDLLPEVRHLENVCNKQILLPTKPVDGETDNCTLSSAISRSPNDTSSLTRGAGYSHADAKDRPKSIPPMANSATKPDANTNAHATPAITSTPCPDSRQRPDRERTKGPGQDSFSTSRPDECAFNKPTKESRKEKSYRTGRRSRTPQPNESHGHRAGQLQRPRYEQGKHASLSRPGKGLSQACSLIQAPDKDERHGRHYNRTSTRSPVSDVSRRGSDRLNVLNNDDVRMRAKIGRLETQDAGCRSKKTARSNEHEREPQGTVTNESERSSSSRSKDSCHCKSPTERRLLSSKDTISGRDFGKRQEGESEIKGHKSPKTCRNHGRSRSRENQRLRGVAVWPSSERDDPTRDRGVTPSSWSFSKKASPLTTKSKQRPDRADDRDNSSHNVAKDSNMRIRPESKTQRLNSTEDRKEHRPKKRSDSNSSGLSHRDLKRDVESVTKPPKRKNYVSQSFNGEQESVVHEGKRSSAEELKSGLKTNCRTNNSTKRISSSSRDPKPKLKSAISLTKKDVQR